MKNSLKFVALAVGGYWLYRKYLITKQAFKQLQAQLVGVKNIRIAAPNRITFNLDARITNPNSVNLVLDPLGAVKLNRVLIYNAVGEHTGNAFLNNQDLNIPANGQIVLQGIRSELFSESKFINPLDLVDLSKFTTKIEFIVAGDPILI